jgi:plastocyanin
MPAMPEPAAIALPVAATKPAHPPMSGHRTPKLALVKKVAELPVAAPAAATLKLSGHVSLTASRGQQIDAGEQADTLVYFVPANGGSRARAGHYTVYTHNRDFSPEAIAVPLGSTVTFVNLDDVRHNVFSVTPGAAFDLGYQGSGEKADHAFGRAGLVLVSCNVHHSMELDVLVVPSPYMVKVGADGNFTLAGLPAGPGTLHFWNPRAQPVSQKVTLPMSAAVSQQILAVRPRLTTALNAGGQP